MEDEEGRRGGWVSKKKNNVRGKRTLERRGKEKEGKGRGGQKK